VCHQVAKPHVRHLMKNHTGPVLSLCPVTHLPLYKALGKCDSGDVLHCANGEIRHDQLIVLSKRIRNVEVSSVVLQTTLRDVKPLINGNELRQ